MTGEVVPDGQRVNAGVGRDDRVGEESVKRA